MIEAQNFITFLSCDKVHKRPIFSKTFPLIKLLHFPRSLYVIALLIHMSIVIR